MTEPLPLFGFQNYAADIMASRDRYGLHDEMGIGKTATTIGAINRIGAQRGIIVAPAMLRENWIKEFHKFSQFKYKICKGQNIHDFIAWSRGRFDILVTSYELATKWHSDFAARGEIIDFIAFDEAHYLKNSNTNRTKAMLGREAGGDNCMTEWAEKAWHITGTCIPNDPVDVYTFLRFAQAMTLGYNDFVRTFFHSTPTTFGKRTEVRADMVPAMQQLIYNNAIRRTHKDVGMELPRVWMREVLVDGETREILELVKDHPGLEQVIVDAIEEGNLASIDVEYIAMLRRLVSKAKAIPYVQMLKWEMDSGAGKRVVFGLHIEPLEYIRNYMCKHGYDFVLVNGATKERDRQEAVRRFMEDPKCVGFVGNLKVAGVGVTLTESADIDMFESDWSPAGNAQAIKRVHRYGQEKEVTARFITLAKSIDESVNRIVAAKTASIAEIEGDTINYAPAY